MPMSSLQDLSLGLTPEVQERAPGHSRQGSAEEALAVPLLLTNNRLSNTALTAGAWSKVQAVHM